MSAYLTFVQFRSQSLMPASFIDEIEAHAPGFIDRRLALGSGWLDTRLAKRYATPFIVTPEIDAPLAIQMWLTAIVTYECWLKRGVSSTDEQFQEYKAAALQAFAESKEAADSQAGLFDLPQRADGVGGSAIAKAGARVYSEQSPYAWADMQLDTARDEDKYRGGTFT